MIVGRLLRLKTEPTDPKISKSSQVVYKFEVVLVTPSAKMRENSNYVLNNEEICVDCGPSLVVFNMLRLGRPIADIYERVRRTSD